MLLIAVALTALTVFLIVIAYRGRYYHPASEENEKIRFLRIALIVVAGLSSLLYFGIAYTLGGEALNDDTARAFIEGYVEGGYYLGSQLRYTMVTRETWMFVSTFETIVNVLWTVAVLFNFWIIIQTKGWKRALFGRFGF